MVARMTETNVNRAEAAPSFERALNVRGREHIQQRANMRIEKLTVRHPIESEAVMVLRYFAPTRTWRPWINYNRKMFESKLCPSEAGLH